MRLTHLKLAGFKSFVDPTVIPFPHALSAVVGPNGCGKSNIIDAVRWVLGESSAKNLRGDDMHDVIFNGSHSRKPVSLASVELLFDNSDARVQGPWQAFSEIAIKRQVTRQGQSDYFVNGQKCRRRDISDLLNGTGLGPRSYSIIEQGTISRLVESKPLELRAFIEEAAGISKYKERKRDTLNRINNSRDNLIRLRDIQAELTSQLDALQVQSVQASTYQRLTEEANALEHNIDLLQWRTLNDDLIATNKQLTLAEQQLNHVEQQLSQDELADDAATRQLSDTQDRLDKLHSECTEHQVAITQLTVSIEHLLKTDAEQRHQLAQYQLKREALRLQREQAQQGITDNSQQLARQHELLAPHINTRAEDQPALLKSEQRLTEIAAKLFLQQQKQQALQSQQQLAQHQHATLASETVKTASQIELLAGKVNDIKQQLAILDPKERELAYQHANEQLNQLKQRSEATEQRLLTTQNEHLALKEQMTKIGYQQQGLVKEQQVLDAQLQHATTQDNAPQLSHFAEHQQLWQLITVESPWQLACDRVLALHLNGYLVAQPNYQFPEFGHCQLWASEHDIIVNRHSLLSMVTAATPQAQQIINHLLADVLYASDEQQLTLLLARLQPQQKIVTPAGDVYTAGGFYRHGTDPQTDIGPIVMAARSQEITEELALLTQTQTRHELALEALAVAISRLNSEYKCDVVAYDAQIDSVHGTKERWLLEQQQWTHLTGQQSELLEQIDQLSTRDAIDVAAIAQLNLSQIQLQQDATIAQDHIKQLKQDKHREKQLSLTLKQQVEHALKHIYDGELAIKKLEMQQANDQQQQQALAREFTQLEQDITRLTQVLADNKQPVTAKQQALDEHHNAKRTLVSQRTEHNATLESLKEQRRSREQQTQQRKQDKTSQQRHIAQLTVKLETLKVKLELHQQRFKSKTDELQSLALRLPSNIDISAWRQQLAQLRSEREAMGAINLTAITQFEDKKSRLDELEQQCNDLDSGLATLEQAIKKIDRESRQKFKHTFNSVNDDFKRLFPRVFGGGSAQLTLTDSDLLIAGVSIMAQPPGKKNSTIHLLSGGEKALTALSLVFAIFQLNPAPFCLLDEVDAPLDDANVHRYCNLVNEMSEKVQFIYITHNKISMEMANHLTGVTMQEAGVSRIVAVDVDEAISIAQQ